MSAEDALQDLKRRVDAIEAGYEFMLAYAAQGISDENATSAGSQVRDFLRKIDDALTGLAPLFRTVVDGSDRPNATAFHPFIEVIGRDAASSQAAVRMVLAQPSITSQTIDNLNASIHVRALLTDLFLIDELL